MEEVWIGFLGTALGALIGFGGTWFQSHHARKAAKEERARLDQREYEDRLRAAYAAWFAAVSRMHFRLQFGRLDDGTSKEDSAIEKLKEVAESGEIQAFSLLLLERSNDAHERIGKMISMLSQFAGEVDAMSEAEAHVATIEFNAELAKLVLWVREHSFALPVSSDVTQLPPSTDG